MATNAYVLINTEPTKTRNIVERLRAIDGSYVREVLGPYDIVLELEAATPGRSYRNVAPQSPAHKRHHQHRNLFVVLKSSRR